MNDKTTELLKHLSDKLGTTAEHLWGVLVKQALIAAIPNAVYACVLAAAWVVAARILWKKTVTDNKPGSYARSGWDESAGPLWVLMVVALGVTVVVVFFSVSSLLTALLNPEYWALKQLLKP